MITSAYSLTATERVLPRLALDFTTGVLDPRVTVTRALNTATRVDSGGLIVGVNADLPRFDYNPVTLAARGLLIEETRTNLFLRSAEFDNASWSRTASGVTADATTSPDGSTNADKLTANATTGLHFIRQNVAVSAGTHTFSVYAKAGEYTAIWVTLDGASNYAIFTLSGAGSSTATTGTASISAAGNGWYRCVFTQTLSAGSAVSFIGTSNPAGTLSFTGDGTSGVFLYGAQLEAGAFATSYIPTTSAALTRNADVAVMTGTNFSDWWQASKGGVLIRARPGTVSGTRPWVQFDDNTADNIIALRGNTTNPELYVKAGGVDQATIDAGTIAASTSYRLAGTWSANDCAASLNGAAPVLDGSATIPAVTQMRIGSDGTNYLNGHIESIEYYDQRLLDASMQVVSSPAGYRSIIGPVMRDTIIR